MREAPSPPGRSFAPSARIGPSLSSTPCLRRWIVAGVTREAGPGQGGSTLIAFVEDPDGYKIELIQRDKDAGGGGLR